MLFDPTLAVRLPGVPRPQGSLKIITNPRTGRAFAKNSDTTASHRNLLVGQLVGYWAGNQPLKCPVSVSLEFYFARPKSHYRTGRFEDELKASAPELHDKMPDVDKLVRLMLDALTIAGVVKDDSQVFAVRGEKRWIHRNDHPSTYLQVWAHEGGRVTVPTPRERGAGL